MGESRRCEFRINNFCKFLYLQILESNYTVTFTRLVHTGDRFDRDLGEVSYLLWAVGNGGIEEGGSGSFAKHVRSNAIPVSFEALRLPSSPSPFPSPSPTPATVDTSTGDDSGEFKTEEFSIRWEKVVVDDEDRMQFTMSRKGEGWIAIGFSKNEYMAESEMIVGCYHHESEEEEHEHTRVEESEEDRQSERGPYNCVLSNRYASSYDIPVHKERQEAWLAHDVQACFYQDDWTTIVFTRKVGVQLHPSLILYIYIYMCVCVCACVQVIYFYVYLIEIFLFSSLTPSTVPTELVWRIQIF